MVKLVQQVVKISQLMTFSHTLSNYLDILTFLLFYLAKSQSKKKWTNLEKTENICTDLDKPISIQETV